MTISGVACSTVVTVGSGRFFSARMMNSDAPPVAIRRTIIIGSNNTASGRVARSTNTPAISIGVPINPRTMMTSLIGNSSDNSLAIASCRT